MAEGMTCYERDEAFCEDQMCLRTGCRIRNERLSTAVTPGREELAELLQSMPGEIELAGIIRDTADAGTSEEYCSWTMANRAAEAVAKRLATVRLAAKPADDGWQDISTAPKDGTSFLATMAGGTDGPYWILFWNGEAFECVASGTTGLISVSHWRLVATPPPDNSLTDPSTMGEVE